MSSPFDRHDPNPNQQEREAQRLLEIYGAELAALATATAAVKGETVLAGVICHKDTAQNATFKAHVRPGVVVRVVEDDTVLALVTWHSAKRMCAKMYPKSVPWLDRESWGPADALPIVVMMPDGCILGKRMFERPAQE